MLSATAQVEQQTVSLSLQATVVDLNGAAVGSSNSSFWTDAGPVNIAAADATISDADSANLSQITATIASPAAGDVLSADTTATNITATFAGSVLTLAGVDTVAHYQQVLRSLTFDISTIASDARIVRVAAFDDGGLASTPGVAIVNLDLLAPRVDLNGSAAGTSNSSTWTSFANAAVNISSPTATLVDTDSTALSFLTARIVSPSAGDVLTASTAGTNLTASFAAGLLTLAGSDTLANYQTVLRSIRFNSTTPTQRTVTVNVAATDDGGLTGAKAIALVSVNPQVPVVDLNGPDNPGNNFTTTWNNTGAVAITDPTATVTDADGASLSSLTAAITNPSTGAILTATGSGDVSVSGNGSASLTLSGNASTAAYSYVLQTIAYDTASTSPPFINPLDLSDLAIWIPTSGVGAYQEGYDIPGGATGIGGFTPPADGGPIGQLEAPGGTYGTYTAGQIAFGPTDRPLLTTVPVGPNSSRSMFSYGTTDTGGNGVFAAATRVNNSINAFSWLNQGEAFTIQFWTYVSSNSGLAPGAVLFGTTDSLNNDAGFSVRLASMPGGVPQLGVYLNDGSTVQMNYGGSAGSQVPLDTLCCVQITYAGRWTDASHLTTQDAPITITVTTADGSATTASSPDLTLTPNTTTLAFSNLTLGVNCDSSNDGDANPFVGDLGDVVIQRGVAPPADLSNYLNNYKIVNENTSPNSSSLLVRQLGAVGGGGLNPEEISMGFMQFDFSDTSKMFADTASYPPTYTTNVTDNGAGVGTVQDELDHLMGLPSGSLQRDAVLRPSALALPTIATGALNGQTALQFAGTATTNTALSLSNGQDIGTTQNGEPELLTGDVTIYLVAKSAVAGDGNSAHQQSSQFLGGFNSEVAFFGSDSTEPNIVRVRTGSGDIYQVDNTLPYPPDEWNTVVIRKNSTGLYVYLPDGSGGATLASSTQLSSAAYLALAAIGWSSSTESANGLIWKCGVYAADIGDTLVRELTIGLQNGGKAAAATLTHRTATINVTATDEGTSVSELATATVSMNAAPTVDLNGYPAGTGFASQWTGATPVAIADAAAATVVDDGTNLVSMTVTLAGPATGDVLAADITGTLITQSYSNGTLSLSGSDTVANYQAVLRSITYDNTAGGPCVALETATIVTSDGQLTSTPVTARIHMPAPSLSLTAGGGSGAPNFTTTWYNQGTIPIANNVLATIAAPSGTPTLSSLTVALATFHAGDVLSVASLSGVSLAISSSYSAGTLTLSGTDTVAHYQQALRFINYNNTAGGPGALPITATFVVNDGTHVSNPVTSTININVGSGQVLGNRLFYNNSKYDGNNGGINSSDDAAIASDKIGYNGVGTATFANVSAFNKGITGIMVDLASGLGTHSAINLTSGDITFKVSPATFVATTYNQLSTWSAAPAPSAISVRMGAGQNGSDRLEITWATGVIKNEWIQIDVHAGGNTGLAIDDVFYFASVIGDSGAGNTPLLSKTDGNDYNVPFNNITGLMAPIWTQADFTKDSKVDGSDATTAISNVFSLHYLANPTGTFAAGVGGDSAPAATAAIAPSISAELISLSPATSSVSSGLNISKSTAATLPSPGNPQQSALISPLATKAIPIASHTPELLQAVEQVAKQFNACDDALDELLAELVVAHTVG